MIVCWFSCGAASACATKLAIEKYGRELQPQMPQCEPPLELNEAFDKAMEFMDGNDEH